MNIFMSIKKYFVNRKRWGIETEKMLTGLLKKHQEHSSEITRQLIIRAKDEILIEKNSEILQLKEKIKFLKDEIHKLREADIEVEELKNELSLGIKNLDYQSGLISEVITRMSIHQGMSDSVIRKSEKLLKKDV